MHNEFTAVVERDGDWFIGYCPEIPGANGQGKTKDEYLRNHAYANTGACLSGFVLRPISGQFLLCFSSALADYSICRATTPNNALAE